MVQRPGGAEGQVGGNVGSRVDYDRFSFPFTCPICTQSETTEEKQRKIDQKQTGTDAISGTRKLFLLWLGVV